MLTRMTVALVLAIGMASPALAVGSDSGSDSSSAGGKPAALAASTPYQDAVHAVKAGDYTNAVRLLKSVVAWNPNDADAWNYLGYSQRRLRQFDEALAAYERALAIKPDHRGATEYLGEFYLQTNQPDKARAQLVRLATLCPDGCEEQEDLAQAVRAWEAAHPGG